MIWRGSGRPRSEKFTTMNGSFATPPFSCESVAEMVNVRVSISNR